ncbi:putative host specificity protein [Lactobacillus phage Lc-Nu]|uniref:Host specificity protein n=1 Tax=Lactobacillus phage Lc-Nu TaxID=146269 RepID=A8YQK1_9CAUD|nr:tail fiber protein and host specificity [Lactobacillus phage Lc-Nu]AAR04639.1 putative host specificity protein [Lactobacillus phage Lc-Nu]
MEYYFSDRKFNIMGVARTTGKGEWLVSADSEVKTTDDRPAIALTLTIPFKTEQEQAIDEMAAENNFVLYQDEEGNGHQMVIASVKHDTLAHIHTVVCTDAGNDLMNEVVGAYTADKAYTIADYILRFTNDSGWEIGINEFPTDVRTLAWTDEHTSLSRIKSVAKDFDAVLSFGFVFVGTTAVKRVINIRHEEASDSLISFEMNKDINNIVKTVDIYDMETSVKAYGATPDGSNDPINLIGYSWTDPTGQFVLDQYGFLHDTIAVQKYSRLLSNSNPNPTQSDWNRVKTFESTTQATLLQAALADLKKYNHPNVNYEVDLANAPYVPLNQTVHVVDENQNLFLSAKVLSVERSRAGHYTKLTLGDYANEQPNLYSALKDIAVKIENIPKAIQFYPWIRYADDDKGTNMSALPAGKKYMAVVYSNKSSVPSDNPADYAGKWALIQGKDGADGVPGAKGADGHTSYFHTAWANDVSGRSGFTVSGGDGKKYIGTYSDFTKADSTNPADYNWALFKGADGDVGPKGDQGLPGKPGADGRTSYAHFAYANSQDGKNGFSTTDPNRKYIGFYSDFTSGDSTNPSDYSWSLIKGADGADGKDGVPGKPGADGRTSYAHFAYANSQDGKNGFSTTDPNRKYIGFYSDFTSGDSTNPSDYSWSLIKGADGADGKDGVPGKPGADGKTSYFHIAYADSSDGRTNFSLDTPGSRKYIGSYTDFTQADSNNPALYSWQLVQGPQGPKGDTGPQGPRGPQGPQGVPGSKDVPYTYIQLGTPASPKKGDLWWHGKTLNDATALQYYNGTAWVDQSIQQAVLSIKKLQSIEIDTSNINSPDINSPFNHVQIDGAKSSGNLELKDANLSILGNIEDNNGNPNGQYYKSLLSPNGMFNYITTPDRKGNVSSVALQRGALQLQTLISDPSAATKKYIQSEFTSADNVTFFYVNTTALRNIDIDWAYIYYTRRGNLVTANFQIHTIANRYNFLRLADIRPGYKPYLTNKIVATCSSFSDPGQSTAMYSSTPKGGTVGWYSNISKASGSYGGSVSYLTQDDYPTGDSYFG